MQETEESGPPPQPAAVGPRLAAGIIDTTLIGIILGAVFPLQLLVTGTLVPLWTIAAVVIACNVVPAWLFGATLGLKLTGLRIVKPSGERADPLELTFRELLGRGVAAIAYLAGTSVGFLAMFTGTGTMTLPVGWALLLFFGGLMLLGVAILGQFAILATPQRRSLADFLGRVMVVEAPARPAAQAATPSDDEMEPDVLWKAQAARRRVVSFFVFELVLLGIGAGLPFVGDLGLSRDDLETQFAQRQADAELESLRKRFRGNQANEELAADLARRLRWRDLDEEAEQVWQDYEAAKKAQDEKQEAKLRAILANVADWDALVVLLSLLREQSRLDDARQVFSDYLKLDNSSENRASYGIWLYDNDFTDEAVEILRAAADDGADTGDVYAYLGFALRELGKKSDARDAFIEAVEKSPNLAEQLEGELRQLGAELPPRPQRPTKRR